MSFQDDFKKFYQDKKLSAQQLEKLSNIQESKIKLFVNLLKPALVGAIAAVVIIFTYNNFILEPLDRISKEVAYNHLKNMPPEVLTSDYKIMNDALDKLDFPIQNYNEIASNKVAEGARYCSILGKIAVQIKLKDIKTGKVATLYQYRPEDQSILSNQNIIKKVIGKTSISMWKKQGIIFVLAQ